MALKDRIKELLQMYRDRAPYLEHNEVLLDIFKGNLLKYVDECLGKQLSGQAYEQARQRIAAINVLKRIIDKEAKIYAGGVTRSVEGGGKPEQAILKWYDETLMPTRAMSLANEYFCLFKSALIHPYLRKNGMPALRVIGSDKFVPFTDGTEGDSTPTGYVFYIEKREMPPKSGRGKGRTVKVYKAVTAAEFVYFTENGEVITGLYAEKNPDGVNPYERLPYVYVNRDPDSVMPVQDTDTLAMTILLPILLTDINFAHMFQAFSIVYGVNLTDKGITFAPNAFWSFKTEPGSDQKPEIGTIKPDADIEGGLNLVANQFALWLNTRGIKPGAVGEVNGSNFASGIAKILDEMDTSELRNAQLPYFQAAEHEVWDLVTNTMTPAWQAQGMQLSGKWKAAARVTTNFAEQLPLVRRGAVIDEVEKEMRLGLTTRKRAAKRLNPQMNDAEIDALLAEVDEETTANTPPPANPPAGSDPKADEQKEENEDDGNAA